MAHSMPAVLAKQAGLDPEDMDKVSNEGAATGYGTGSSREVSTTGGKGMILWGEPHLQENWEVTPGFLRKWAWVTSGSVEELVRIANGWRAARCDEAIEVEMDLNAGGICS